MLDSRLMVILENRICVFGTHGLVHQVLRRYAEHAVPDSVLEERLSLLRRDVTSWNVLVDPGKGQKNITFSQPYSVWGQLQQDADVLMVATRFGSKVRVDFSIHAAPERGREFFTRKAGFFTEALLSKPAAADAATRQDALRRLENLSLEPNRIQGSVHLSHEQFDAWCDHLFLARAGIVPAATNGD